MTTTVGGDFIEGSGFHCGLQRGTIQASPRWALALALMTLALIAAQILLRRRAQR